MLCTCKGRRKGGREGGREGGRVSGYEHRDIRPQSTYQKESDDKIHDLHRWVNRRRKIKLGRPCLRRSNRIVLPRQKGERRAAGKRIQGRQQKIANAPAPFSSTYYCLIPLLLPITILLVLLHSPVGRWCCHDRCCCCCCSLHCSCCCGGDGGICVGLACARWWQGCDGGR